MNETITPPMRDPAKARAARTRIKHERWAAEMRAAGWDVNTAGPSFETRCPVDQKDAVFVRGEDRYFHLDGSENYSCWVRLTRGE